MARRHYDKRFHFYSLFACRVIVHAFFGKISFISNTFRGQNSFNPKGCSTMRALGVLSSVILCFLSERKPSPRCLQALAIQVDRCIARKPKMATKTIMGFLEGLCTQYFHIRFSELRRMCLCVDIYLSWVRCGT